MLTGFSGSLMGWSQTLFVMLGAFVEPEAGHAGLGGTAEARLDIPLA